MRKRLPVLVVFSIITFLIACQKQLSDPGINGPDPVDGSKHLVKITYRSDHRMFIDSFTYDAQNRCTRMTQIILDSNVAPDPDPYVYFYDFHYNGSEMQPYKITDTSEGRDMNWYIAYDAQKRKVIDSMTYLSTGESEISYYSYTTGRIVASTVNSNFPTAVYLDSFFLSGNNCSRYAGFANTAGTQYWWQYVNTYDNGISPLSTMNIANSVFFGATNTLGDFEGLNKNNDVSSTYMDSHGMGPSVTNFQYVYGTDGLPLSGTYGTVGLPESDGTVIYEYNK